MKVLHIGIILGAALAVAACGSSGKRDSASPRPATTPPADTSGIDGRDSGRPTPLTAEQRMQKEKEALTRDNTVYFDFDRAELKPEGVALVRRHGEFLVRHPDVRVTLEGHTDERGTREYNIGLGERRAQSVASTLRAMGVSPRQLSLVSYGEERPAQLGSNESAWAKNRRVEIVYP